MTKKEKKFKFKKNSNIGSPDAETDDILFDVFVDIDNLEEIIDTKSQKSILIGRTGTGKSAIIKYVKKNCQKVTEIAPEAMSLRFLSNSTILQYFKKLDVNLNLFYKVLWKHVFMVELLKLYFSDTEEKIKKRTFLQSLLGNNKIDPKKERAVKYMEEWTDDFWENTEYRVKSFEKSIRENFASSIGISIEALNAQLTEGLQEDRKITVEAKQKAESIIHSSQAIEILDIFQIMKNDLFATHQKKFFIVIDDLDKEWIEDSLRYELIGAMIETIKEFRQLQGVKIIISIRENLNEIVFSGLKNKGGQREKFKPLFSEMIWTKGELLDFADNRLKLLSDDKLDVKSAFFNSRRGNKNGFDFVLERTYYRPRDVLSYINHAIENSKDKYAFSKDILAKAEPTYSLDRFQAIEDEWSENYGEITEICEFLRGSNNGFKLKSLNEDDFANIYLDDNPELKFSGNLLHAIISWKSNEIHFNSFLKKILFILFRIGILGIKKGTTYKLAFYYDRDIIIGRNDVSTNSRFYVHPSLYSYFKINVLDQLPEE